MCFELVVINKANTRLIHAWDCLLNKGVQFPESDVNRFSSPALHLGVWEVYRSTPCISTDSRQPEEVIIAMDIFLNLIKKYIAPEISNLLQTHCPIQYAHQMQYTLFCAFIYMLNMLNFSKNLGRITEYTNLWDQSFRKDPH
jgi:hypothetical protein